VRLTAYAVVYTTLASLGLVMLRRSLADSSAADIVRTPGFYVGGLLYAASFATFLASLRRFEALTVFPLFTGITYVTVTIAAVLLLSEPLTGGRLAGIAFVAAGVVLLVR
jgi:multidrug transporter EmrE-like cation transporter